MGKFDVFVKDLKFCNWNFWKYLGKGCKITFDLNSSVSSFCFSQNLYCLYRSLRSDMRFCAQTTLCLLPYE